MASISRASDGRKVIQFGMANGKRRTLRLGKVSQRAAEMVKYRVEQLAFAKIAGHAPDDETARWLTTLDVKMLDKLAAVELIPRREQTRQTTLQEYLDAYVSGRTDVKGSTAIVYGHTRRNLINYFGASKQLRDITAGDGDAWRIWLAKQENLAENTVRRRCGIAKQFFRAAIRRKLLVENPFADLAAAVKANTKRQYYVTSEEAQKVINACPDAQWRLLFVLSRYGGLRCPSEHLGLRWGDVDFASGRMTVHSPKTEHHEGGESRQVPIFPELRPYLEDVRELAEPGTEHVITRYRDSNANLRTRLYKIIKRAGLKPWPKLFQNLRSTRETELAETYPIHVVCAWIGNTQAVAAKHYLQVTDAHYEQAANATQSALQNPVQALQNTVQQAAADNRTESQNPQETREFAGACDDVRHCTCNLVGDEGLEPPTSTV